MPTAEITIAKVFTKQGEKNGKAWTKYDLKPEEDPDKRYTTFMDSIGRKAQEWEGSRVRVTYEDTERGTKVTELALLGPPAEPNGDKPKEYRKAAENPETQRSIAASVALKEAVAAFAHTITPAMTAKEAADRIEPLASSFFLWLQGKAGTLSEEEIPFE